MVSGASSSLGLLQHRVRRARACSLGLTALALASCATTQTPQPTPAPAATSEADPAPAPLTLPGKALSLHRIHSDPPLAGSSPRGLSFSPDGSWLGYLSPNEADSEVLDLWAYALTTDGTTASATAMPLVKTSDLVGGAEKELSEAEKMARERKRIKHRGIVGYQWCGKSGERILFPLSGDLYVVTLPQKGTTDAPKVNALGLDKLGPRTPKCTSDGSSVVFVSNREVWQVSTSGGDAVQLTKGANDVVSHGLSEFVAQEEMGRYTGHWPSPDGRYIAYLEVDETPVSQKTRARITAEGTDTFVQRYPGAGEANAIVKVFVVDTKSKKSKQVRIPASLLRKDDTDFDIKDGPLDAGYLPRIGWFGQGKATRLWVQWQNRKQTRLVLLSGAAPTFKLDVAHEEVDEAWVDVHDDLRVLAADAGKLRFVWPTESSGVRQLIIKDGSDVTPLTRGKNPVLRTSGFIAPKDADAGWVFTTRATERSLQQHLFATSLDGKVDVQLTQREGAHGVSLSKDGRFFVDKHSNFGVPADVRLFAILDDNGSKTAKEVAVLEANDAAELKSYALPTATFHVVKAEDGTELNALLLEPLARREGQKVPAVVYTYGGPTAQVVAKKWSRLYPYFVHLTQRGFAVFLVDNRGSGNRERSFTRAMKNAFGQVEIQDQITAARWLQSNADFVDPDRIGIWGWSYGGYTSALAILDDKAPYAAAASVAPVTDWTLYDTHYTERYVGTPQGNADVYKASSVLDKAAQLKKPYLLVHGTADDNVLFDHSLKLMQQFQDHALPFETMIYPGGAHGLRGRQRQLHVFTTLTQFFERQLKPDVPAVIEDHTPAAAEGAQP